MFDRVLDSYLPIDVVKYHRVKSVRIWSFSGPYFPVFRLNTGNTDQKNSEFGHFSRRVYLNYKVEQGNWIHWKEIQIFNSKMTRQINLQHQQCKYITE